MEPIKKEYQIELLKIKVSISDGFVVLITNDPRVTLQIYETAKKQDRHVIWDARRQACIEFYPHQTQQEILELTDAQINKVKTEGKEAIKNAIDKKNKSV